MANPMAYENVIEIPYRWTTGPVIGRFLTALRDEKKILAARCSGCPKIWTPPPDCCPLCMEDFSAEKLFPVSDEGTLTNFTRVELRLLWRPCDPPYAIISVKLDGADTEFLHLVKSPTSLEKLRMGARVKAVWKAERKGLITDIEEFAILGGGS